MKKMFLMIVPVLLAGTGVSAQAVSDLNGIRKYRDVSTLVANVRQTRHHIAMKEDKTIDGKLYFGRPDSYGLVLGNGEERLLAVNGTYTMVRNGKNRSISSGSKAFNPFEAMRQVLDYLLAVDEQLAGREDITLLRQEGKLFITFRAVPEGKPKQKRGFTSCVAVIDMESSELCSFRMDEANGSYTRYDFSRYVANGEIEPDVFNVK